MKIISALATIAALIVAIIACNNTPSSETSESHQQPVIPPVQPESEGEWFTLEGFGAEALYEALSVAPVNGEKKVSGNTTLNCRQTIPNIPEGAQGLFFPVATCTAYPQVTFPDGAQGLVAPWFQIGGMQGYELFRALPLTAADNTKSYRGELSISCKLGEQAVCSFSKSDSNPEPQPKITLDGSTAEDIFNQIGGRGRTRQLQGNASLSCTLQTGELPEGAQGIIAPMAYCVAFPHVTFPDGAQGLVAPWFILQGLNGYQLYRAMPESADSDRVKSANGAMLINCKKQRRTTQCTIDY